MMTRIQHIAQQVEDLSLFITKVYLVFVFVFMSLEHVFPGYVSNHMAIRSWILTVVFLGLITLIASYFTPKDESSFQSGKVYYAMLIASILAWALLTIFV